MLIGKTITVSEATNPTLIGKRGLVIDETKQTITFEQPDNKTITIIKTHLTTYTIEAKK